MFVLQGCGCDCVFVCACGLHVSLGPLVGMELRGKNVAVIGTGAIGTEAIKLFKVGGGFAAMNLLTLCMICTPLAAGYAPPAALHPAPFPACLPHPLHIQPCAAPCA